MKEGYSRRDVEDLIGEIIKSYNCAPNPGIIGAEEVIESARKNGRGKLAEKLLSIVREINSSRPYVLDDFHRERMLSKFGY